MSKRFFFDMLALIWIGLIVTDLLRQLIPPLAVSLRDLVLEAVTQTTTLLLVAWFGLLFWQEGKLDHRSDPGKG